MYFQRSHMFQLEEKFATFLFLALLPSPTKDGFVYKGLASSMYASG